MKGIFITFEGTEGSGKTTIINNLIKELKSNNYDAISTREPGGVDISEQIRNVILNVDNTKMDKVTEALLYAASRRQHLVEVLIPGLENGKVVICDRYIDSSLAYQGYARGIGIDKVFAINQFAIDGLFPDLTIYIKVAPEIGLSRIERNERMQDRLDLETIEFHKKVYDGYIEVGKKFSNRFKVVDGERDISLVYKDVKAIVFDFLENYNGSWIKEISRRCL